MSLGGALHTSDPMARTATHCPAGLIEGSTPGVRVLTIYRPPAAAVAEAAVRAVDAASGAPPATTQAAATTVPSAVAAPALASSGTASASPPGSSRSLSSALFGNLSLNTALASTAAAAAQPLPLPPPPTARLPPAPASEMQLWACALGGVVPPAPLTGRRGGAAEPEPMKLEALPSPNGLLVVYADAQVRCCPLHRPLSGLMQASHGSACLRPLARQSRLSTCFIP